MKDITSREQLESLISSNSGNLIVAYTTQTCGYCRLVKVELEQIAKQSEAFVAVFDITQKGTEVQDKGIVGVPYLEFYRDSSLIKAEAGYQRRDQLLSAFA